MRAATVGYLSVIKGAEGGVTKLGFPQLHLHPSLDRAYQLLEPAWRQVRVDTARLHLGCTHAGYHWS